jgi:hypothetical protein
MAKIPPKRNPAIAAIAAIAECENLQLEQPQNNSPNSIFLREKTR